MTSWTALCGLACAFLAVALPVATSAQKFEGLADTPPMGWNSWNEYACNIDERLIRATADRMVENGMRDAGYAYVNIDDCWHGERDADGNIQADPIRFPAGIKALADYVHAKGMKLGIYSDAGSKTCGGRPGSQGHEYADARQYAKWGVDYLKYDWCSTGDGAAKRNPQEAYRTMRDAIRAAGRPMVFSICEWGDSKPWEWARDVGHLWRTTGDIINCWDCVVNHGAWFSSGFLSILDRQAAIRTASGPGHWNDPDMMEVGNMPSLAQDRSHFTMWAMLSAPLIAGTNIETMKPGLAAILTDREVIAIDQDELGIPALPWVKGTEIEVWAKPLDGGGWAIAFLNRTGRAQAMTFDWKRFDLKDDSFGKEARLSSVNYAVRNVWAKRAAGDTAKALVVKLAPFETALFRLSVLP